MEEKNNLTLNSLTHKMSQCSCITHQCVGNERISRCSNVKHELMIDKRTAIIKFLSLASSTGRPDFRAKDPRDCRGRGEFSPYEDRLLISGGNKQALYLGKMARDFSPEYFEGTPLRWNNFSHNPFSLKLFGLFHKCLVIYEYLRLITC